MCSDRQNTTRNGIYRGNDIDLPLFAKSWELKVSYKDAYKKRASLAVDRAPIAIGLLHTTAPGVLKENKDIFAPLLAKIFNNSISQNEFPDNLKLGDIAPVVEFHVAHKYKVAT